MALAKVSFGKNSKRIKSDYCLSRQIGCEGEKQLSFRKTKTIFKLSQQTRLSALFIGWDQACGSNLRQIPFCAKEIKNSWGLALALNKKLYIYELELMILRRSCEFTQKLVLSLLNIESISNPVASGHSEAIASLITWIERRPGSFRTKEWFESLLSLVENLELKLIPAGWKVNGWNMIKHSDIISMRGVLGCEENIWGLCITMNISKFISLHTFQ